MIGIAGASRSGPSACEVCLLRRSRKVRRPVTSTTPAARRDAVANPSEKATLAAR
jgi:hypothetical protein